MKIGYVIPFATFKTTTESKTTTDIFSNKRILVFSLPGAFTPTCSNYQVPTFEKHYDSIKRLDILYLCQRRLCYERLVKRSEFN